MPRRLVKHLILKMQSQRHKWYLRMFGEHLTDPHLWSLNRRSITTAFGAGIAIAFIPLPVHTVLGALLAIWFGWNLPVILAAAYIVNPFTIVPIYLAAYRVGAWLLRELPFPHELGVAGTRPWPELEAVPVRTAGVRDRVRPARPPGAGDRLAPGGDAEISRAPAGAVKPS